MAKRKEGPIKTPTRRYNRSRYGPPCAKCGWGRDMTIHAPTDSGVPWDHAYVPEEPHD